MLTAMKKIASIHIRRMTASDLPLCNSLTAEAGWNQTTDDWLRAMALDPAGCWVAEWEGLPVATTTTCTFGQVTWIAMVLVKEVARGQGIAGHLLRHAIDYAAQKAVTTIRLDATSAGHGLYEKLGFEDEYPLVRYSGILPTTTSAANLAPISADSGGSDSLFRLDEQITGTPRASFLRALMNADDAPFYGTKHTDGILTGYGGCRRGRNAVQMGPVLATTPAAGIQLMHALCSNFSGDPIFADIPLQNTAAIKWANELGLTEQRRFMRMCKGLRIRDKPELIWASSGPEKG
jgi:GNAT superfamily N-acetyltransferase